jgi:hypothetical protein
MHFPLLQRQNQLSDQLKQKVLKDRLEVDYSAQSLGQRNNPWFFSKSYTVSPLTDDTDFYFLIETHVGQSAKVQQRLKAESEILNAAKQKQANPLTI